MVYYTLHQSSIEAVTVFTNPFSSSVEDNELYVLSLGVPAKPGKTKDLIEGDEIGRMLWEISLTHFQLKICLSQPH